MKFIDSAQRQTIAVIYLRPATDITVGRPNRHSPVKRIKSGILKIVAALLLVTLNTTGLLSVSYTFSYLSDAESSLGNLFGASILDLELDAEPWQPPGAELDLMPDDTVTRAIDALNVGFLSFQYNASTTLSGPDFDLCQALELKVSRNGVQIYSGLLANFVSATSTLGFLGVDNWFASTTLPFNAPDTLQDKTCNFKFVFAAWQIGFPPSNGGFVDIEELDNTLQTGTWIIPGTDYMGPIDDSYVNEKQGNQNYGTDQELAVKSKDSNENKRTFIKFDFHFPAGTNINVAYLTMYLKDAPSEQRFYEVRRALNGWLENTITWANQPLASTTVSDTQTAETTPKWLSWTVTNDVKETVAGSIPNYGWRINDSVENSASAREGKFASQENNDEEKRPYLEVQFSAPQAPTAYPVINEVYYDVVGTKGSNTHNEWVEIYNPTDSAVDISDWQICDNNFCDSIPLLTPAIPAKGFALIANDASTWTTYWSVPVATVKIALGSEIGNGLGNDGDRLALKDSGSITVDAMSYGNDVTFFGLPISEKGDSLARIVKGYDTDTANDWIINAMPNPGSNPAGDDGEEFIRFTDSGVLVASSLEELELLVVEEAQENLETIEQESEIEQEFETEDILPEQTESEPPLDLQDDSENQVESESETPATPEATPSADTSNYSGGTSAGSESGESEEMTPSSTPTPEPTDETLSSEETLEPSETPAATETLEPSESPEPTDEPAPTDTSEGSEETPELSESAAPTETPPAVEPSATNETPAAEPENSEPAATDENSLPSDTSSESAESSQPSEPNGSEDSSSAPLATEQQPVILPENNSGEQPAAPPEDLNSSSDAGDNGSSVDNTT